MLFEERERRRKEVTVGLFSGRRFQNPLIDHLQFHNPLFPSTTKQFSNNNSKVVPS